MIYSMLTNEIRRKFLEYFEKKGHTIVPSSSVIPHDDPTLLFINAGMNQFKDVFLGKSVRDYKRAVSSQKCIRAGGKHNDLENVGHTARHLTFLEMLGNFSFGDYFKQETIKFSWELSTEVFGFDPEKLWPTVYKDDDEAFEIWTSFVPAEKITRFGEKQNFWAMGDVGPCGPCSELLYDRGPKYGTATNPADDHNETRFWEFWNLVFMQQNRVNSKTLPLPKPSIDTGAGLERVATLIQNVESIYDSDILASLINKVEDVSGKKYDQKDESQAAAFRVIADHIRSLSFAIADGAQPSNVERGYVLRKILRRAVRYGRTLGLNKPFLAQIFPRLLELMGGDYKELVAAKTRIEEILTIEEESFIRTLQRGGNILGKIIEHAHAHKRTITGEEAFKLKDTYGFPLDEILLLAKDADLQVDIEMFNKLELKAKELSRKGRPVKSEQVSKNLFTPFVEKHGKSEFIGYTEHEKEVLVLGLVIDDEFVPEINAGVEAMVILDKSPFYAEKGGQVGDKGIISSKDCHFDVFDCQEPFSGIIGHLGKLTKGKIKVGDHIRAKIDIERRQKIENNHTATHLLHYALCDVLGEHVKQAGSVVEEARLRFDFNHHKALSNDEIREIENLVNAKIRQNDSVESYEISYSKAQEDEKIKQFFGEKYDSKVRVIDLDFSKELCGGTHTDRVGNIGFFRITKEGSIAAGVRRIEAVTGQEAIEFNRRDEDLINEIAANLKTHPNKLKTRIEKLIQENKELAKEIKELQKLKLKDIKKSLKVEKINDINFINDSVSLAPSDANELSESAIEDVKSTVVAIASKSNGTCQIFIRVTDDLISKGIFADEIIKTISPIIQGGGGGKKTHAQAGGKAPENIIKAIDAIKKVLQSKSSS